MVTQLEKQNSTVEQKNALTQEQLIQFGKGWFDKLNRHVDVEEIIKLVSDTNLDVVFPDMTIHNHDDFRQWYAGVGETYYDQDHTIERFDITISDAAKIEVTVVWRAKQRPDGKSLAIRATQTWVVGQSLTTRQPVITNYAVHTFSDAD